MMLASCDSVLFIWFTINALVYAAMRLFSHSVTHTVLPPEMLSVGPKLLSVDIFDVSKVCFPNKTCGMVSVDMSRVCFPGTPCVVVLVNLSSVLFVWFTVQSLMCVVVLGPKLLSVDISDVCFHATPCCMVSVKISKVYFPDTPCDMVLMSLSSVLLIWFTLSLSSVLLI